jgi:hypothetical protein
VTIEKIRQDTENQISSFEESSLRTHTKEKKEKEVVALASQPVF